MNARILTVIAGAVAALVGVIFLAPDLFGFLGLPPGFTGLGLERVITGFALLLLGFIGVLSELDPQPNKRRAASPFAFQPEPAGAGPAGGGATHDAFNAPLGAAPRPVPEWSIAAAEPAPADNVIPYPESDVAAPTVPDAGPEKPRVPPPHLTLVEPTPIDPEPELPFGGPDEPKPAA